MQWVSASGFDGEESCLKGDSRQVLLRGHLPEACSLLDALAHETLMSNQAVFQSASPYQKDVLALPVTDLDQASAWYSEHFAMVEVLRRAEPHPAVVLERDGVRIGFEINGGDATQDGAAIRVVGIEAMKTELESRGVKIGNWRVDEHEGKKLQVFFVVAPDGLCYYFNEPL